MLVAFISTVDVVSSSSFRVSLRIFEQQKDCSQSNSYRVLLRFWITCNPCFHLNVLLILCSLTVFLLEITTKKTSEANISTCLPDNQTHIFSDLLLKSKIHLPQIIGSGFHALPNVFEKSAVTTKPLLFRKLRYGAIEGQMRPNWALWLHRILSKLFYM